MRQRSYLSAADVRIEVIGLLQRTDWSTAIGRSLASRFQEVIVDEAQDCNPLDCQIIGWLRDKGIAVTVVADLDQAIYGFRRGTPAGLLAIANAYDAQDRLALTGNFRSSPSICSVAATLRVRAVPDRAIGETSVIVEPVHVLAYNGGSVTPAIGRCFRQLMLASGIAISNGIVLAHARKNALRACGFGCEEEAGNSNVAGFARAVGTFWSPSVSNRARESAVRSVERVVLDLMGKIDDGEVPSRAAERLGLNPRWLRRCALQLISSVPRNCANTCADRTAWVSDLREQVLRLGLVYRPGISERQYFQNRANADWHRLLVTGDAPGLRSSTIHEAKGKEYEAVCVVVPPDSRERTEQLITSWETRTDHEPKRVIYVGITRAQKLVTIAIPAPFRARLTRILEAAQVPFEVRELTARD
jgi:hypothetical protein